MRERLGVFSGGGRFVFNPVLKIQPNTPVENVLEMFRIAREGDWGLYPPRATPVRGAKVLG